MSKKYKERLEELSLWTRNLYQKSKNCTMALILSIETATQVCSTALHRDDGHLLAYKTLYAPKSHSLFLLDLIDQLLNMSEVHKRQLDAIALSQGPGSYTGLRVGAAMAKGLCFSLDLPLIAISTLEAMAYGVQQENLGNAWLCPMIDARRMEVYCQLFDANNQPIIPPQAAIIEPDSFEKELQEQQIIFFGNGATKCQPVLAHQKNALFLDNIHPEACHVGKVASAKFRHKDFADVVYFEPYYLKEFYTKPPRNVAPERA